MPRIFAMIRLASGHAALGPALATLGGEVSHQVLIGVAEDVITFTRQCRSSWRR